MHQKRKNRNDSWKNVNVFNKRCPLRIFPFEVLLSRRKSNYKALSIFASASQSTKSKHQRQSLVVQYVETTAVSIFFKDFPCLRHCVYLKKHTAGTRLYVVMNLFEEVSLGGWSVRGPTGTRCLFALQTSKLNWRDPCKQSPWRVLLVGVRLHCVVREKVPK